MSNNQKERNCIGEFNHNSKNVEEFQRKLVELDIELQKMKKDDQLEKEPNILISAKKDVRSESPKEQSITDIDPEDLIRDIMSDDPFHRYAAVQFVRKLLCQKNFRPIDKMIKSGIVPLLVRCLEDENINLVFEAVWALTNVASGTSEQTGTVIEAGAVPKFVDLLKSSQLHIVEQTIWALSNVAGDGSGGRDLVLSYNVMEILINLITPALPLPLLRKIVWTISNLCRHNNPSPNFEIVASCLRYLADLLDHYDNDVVADCCWALPYLTDGTNRNYERQTIIRFNIVPKVLRLLTTKDVHIVAKPALRVVGNIVTGNDEQTDEVINNGGLKQLAIMLNSTYNNIVKEAALAIYNITVGNNDQIIQKIIDADIDPLLVNVIKRGHFPSLREAAWAINSITRRCTLPQFTYFINTGVLIPYIQLLDSDAGVRIFGPNVQELVEAFSSIL